MITAPSILIRAPGHFVRVLRLAIVDGRCSFLAYRAFRGPGCCRRCGCVDRYGCAQGCHWANADETLCSACEGKGVR
jgi:hypothetical protein